MTQTTQDSQLKISKLEAMLEEDPAKQVYRIDRAAFTDQELFELEMKYIFEGNWIFMAHESQIPNPNDYYTLYVGRQPVIITRDKNGQLHAMANTCTHRGATLARHKKGNKSSFTCPFHGWTFNNAGKLLKVKDQNPDAGYPECFNKEGSHDLVKLGAFESYRGFLFGSLNPDVVPLVEHLGEATKIIDMIVDQAPDGIEVLRGSGAYTFDANWKLQAENGADGYHVTATHWNYAATQGRRTTDGKVDTIKAMSAGGWARQGGGSYSFKNGHMLLWTNWANPEDRPLWGKRAEWIEKFGEARADWMLKKSRNLCLYPNVYLMDQFSSQIRVLRPLSVDKTEAVIYCIAPKGEAPEARQRRLRQYEDFFNATGMATPDDLEEFRSCQHGFNARIVKWNDMTRGATHWVQGPDENADLIGLKPELSGVKTEDEGLYVMQHQYWVEVMKKAILAEQENGAN
ncbi:benzoate 1,2-dioxygenase large subunit [Zoogloea oryzae]|uniref:Benzoate 1,2-dioxygenase large subunit n=1 Tax=Zoogloea oryzae TaxID=310767 RepID=A0ABQ6FD91_9RHOO|nr:benzoate 1,2-dioxygenase large subunit [Zoogloea oryzae]GLT23557.1 benzoate 1,2-dioxygenase large subunit [Zoogloea oryzae]